VIICFIAFVPATSSGPDDATAVNTALENLKTTNNLRDKDIDSFEFILVTYIQPTGYIVTIHSS